MDYRKSNAPSNTVTRDMMKLSADTGNVYETVMIIGKRAKRNFRSLLLITIIWKKFSKTESRSRSPVIMKSFRSRL